MRSLLFLFVVFHAGISFSQTSAAAADSSLVEAGIPALGREWSGADYLQAAKVLAEGKVPLPRLTDEQGRLFLQRLTTTDNFSRYRDSTLPLEKRLPDYFNLLTGATAILKEYLAAADKKLDVHREFAQQLAFGMRMAAMGVQLMDEYLPTIPKDDKYETRMAGMKRAYGGLMTMYGGAEASLSDTRFFSPSDLTLLVSTMAETLPVVKKGFSADYKAEFRKKLESHRTTFTDAEGAKALQQMIDEFGA